MEALVLGGAGAIRFAGGGDAVAGMQINVHVTTDDIIRGIDRLTLGPDDVLLITFGDQFTLETMHAIYQQVREHLGRNHLVIFTRPDITLSALSEAEMRLHGWVRVKPPFPSDPDYERGR